MSLAYNKDNVSLAQTLRKNATPQEKQLWYQFLSRYPIRFQRQKAIGDFIVDFYCHRAKLVIEIDGSQHYTESGEDRDAVRTEILERLSLRVIRFTTRQIDTEFGGVCECIDRVVNEALQGRR